MKRCFSILICILLLAMSCCYAETSNVPDISGLSIDELIELRNIIDSEIFKKNCATVLYAGDYIVGVDIPAGDYTVTQNDPDVGAAILIYKTLEARNEYNSNRSENDYRDYYERYNIDGGASKKITLFEGQMMEVQDYDSPSLTIAKTTKLFMD